MKKIGIILMTLGLIMIGCEDKSNGTSEIEAEIIQLLDEDDAFGIDGLDDEGAVSGFDGYEEGLENSGLAKILEEYHPDSGFVFRFGRRIDKVTRTVTFTHGEDNVIADINLIVTGNFIIVALDTSNSDTTTIEKPFTSDFQRSVRFVKRSTVDDKGRIWRVDAFTLGVGSTGNKVSINKLEYFTWNETSSVWESAFTMEDKDVLNTFIPRDSLPTFLAWTPVKVEVSVSNLGPEFDYQSGEGVMLHYGRGVHFKARRPMRDDGIEPDEIANDNVFTKIWLVHGPGYESNGMPRPQRVFRAFFDVIDFGTLFDSEEDVHAALWGIPYKSVRPVTAQ